MAAALLALGACEGTLPPMRDAIEPGRDPFVIFVGGRDRAGGDLYAVPAGGGPVLRLTYSGVGEMRPVLAPDGGAVAFLRGGSLRDSTPGTVWVMNLLSGSERRLTLPPGAGPPERVGWMDGGRFLVVEAGGALYHVAAPPASGVGRAVPAAERAPAESALAVRLGDPVFGLAVRCGNGDDICVAGAGDTGAPALLARGARDPARWGRDSVAYLAGGVLLVRPLGPGRERRVELRRGPAAPRHITMFAGARPDSS
ncbi:MAG TPA: hypothetical protein VMN37_03975 [Gemmatimonadales bacterium]|nr:hypothetical protein [Gemmatimonadales bacterium]